MSVDGYLPPIYMMDFAASNKIIVDTMRPRGSAMMTPRWINNRVVQGSSIFAKSNELLRHTDVMDFAASNERIGQWVGTEDSDKVLAKTLS